MKWKRAFQAIKELGALRRFLALPINYMSSVKGGDEGGYFVKNVDRRVIIG